MTEFDERSDEIDRKMTEMDEWIATKMATKDDLFWAAIICIAVIGLLTICVQLLTIALMVG